MPLYNLPPEINSVNPQSTLFQTFACVFKHIFKTQIRSSFTYDPVAYL